MSELPNLAGRDAVAIDLETTGLKWWTDSIFGVAISYQDAGRVVSHYWDVRQTPAVIPWLQRELHQAKRVVNHNLKFDHHFLKSVNVTLPENIWCTQIAACLIDENELSYSLDSLAKKHLKERKHNDIYEELAEFFGGPATRNAQISNMEHAPVDLVADYAKKDTELALKLYLMQKDEIISQGLQPILSLELALYPVIVDMEHEGVRVDVNQCESALDQLTEKIQNSQKRINQLTGLNVNVNSRNDMLQVFSPTLDDKNKWRTKDGILLPSTPAGKPSINVEALNSINTEESKTILEIRKLLKCRDTFLKGHVMGHQHNGIIHPNINQTRGESGVKEVGTRTGRLSCDAPALQQIPARDYEVASIVRPLFLPDADQVWYCSDYSQFEFRMFAHYMNSPQFNRQYQDNPDLDFHQIVADITGLPRSASRAGEANAKQMNLGLIFGMGGGRMAQMMGLPYSTESVQFRGESGFREVLRPGHKAQEILNLYHEKIPNVNDLIKKATAQAKARGYVTTLFGRKIRFPKGQFTHKAISGIVQGSSADCLKKKMIELHEYLKGTDGRLLMTVHDEVNCSIPAGNNRMIRDIKEIMENYTNVDGYGDTPITLRIPIKSEHDVGPNWAAASGKGAKE